MFVGPSQLFAFPDSLVLMGVGQALAGIFTAFMMIPGLPEMVESALPLYPGQERKVNDLSSGLFNSFLGFGQVIAPAYGSFMVEAVGFRVTSDVVGLLCVFFALLYFVSAGGASAFRETCRKKRAQNTGTSTPTDPAANDNDFFWLKPVEQDEVSHHSRKSRTSSFYSLSPYSPLLQRMRIGSLVQERTSPRRLDFGAVGANADYNTFS